MIIQLAYASFDMYKRHKVMIIKTDNTFWKSEPRVFPLLFAGLFCRKLALNNIKVNGFNKCDINIWKNIWIHE